MLKGIKNIIWDWNGTLLDDVDICVESIDVLLRKRALPPVDLERYRAIFTFPVRRYYEELGFDFEKEDYDSVAHEFMHEYLGRLTRASLFPQVIPSLEVLEMKGMRQAVLSVMEQDTLEASISTMGIRERFELLMGSRDHHAHGKLENAEKIMKELGLQADETLLIGDTLHDADVAALIGCKCVLVAEGHQSKKRLLQTPYRVIDSLGGLTGLD